MSWIDIHLYVDSEELGRATIELSVGYDTEEINNQESNDCHAYYKTCEVTSQNSCSIQLTSCDIANEEMWIVSIFGKEAPFQSVGSLPFTLLIRTKIAIPLGMDPPSQKFLSSTVYSGLYDQYHIDIAQGELYIIQINILDKNCINSVHDHCNLYVYFASNQLAGDTCTSPCYESYDVQEVTSDEPLIYQLHLCSGIVSSDQIYIGILGYRRELKSPISYSIQLERPTTIVTPLQSLYEGSPPEYRTLEGNSSQNFTITLGDPINDKYLLLYSFIQNINEYPGEITLSLYQGHENYLYCPGRFHSCTLNATNIYCSIVIPFCEYKKYGELTYVQVEQQIQSSVNNPNDYLIEFGIGYYTRSISIDSLIIDKPEAGVLMQNTYHHYSIYGEIGKTLIIEVYIDSSDVDNFIYLFASTETLAGFPPCFTNNFICRSKTKCIYVVNSCNVFNIQYFISVYTDSRVPTFSPLQFTINSQLKNPVIPLSVNTASTERIHANQKIFFTISFDSYPSTAQYSYILVSTIDNSNITVSVAPTLDPIASCPCFDTASLHLQESLVNNSVAIIPLPNCIIGKQNFTILVQQIVSESERNSIEIIEKSSSPVEFTIGFSTSSQDIIFIKYKFKYTSNRYF